MKNTENYFHQFYYKKIDNILMKQLSQLPLTSSFISALPKIDIHVHLPGTISPQTAWQLGLKNGLLTVKNGQWSNGPKSLSSKNPHTHYSDIFYEPENIFLDCEGVPHNLRYNITHRNFKSFDRVMATVQGHRSPPGGIQSEDDLKFVLMQYLKDCLTQNVFYTEIQQNIRIAYHIYPQSSHKEARHRLYALLWEVSKEFLRLGVHVRFLHCFNKTQAAGLDHSTSQRALEAAEWLKESRTLVPGLFVGIQAAGHEKDESGWPVHLKDGYDAVAALGLGCEAHGGEGIGVEHMMDIVRTLPVSRLAHGFQVIESEAAIEEIISKDITLVMSPIINLGLGACVYHCPNKKKPLARGQGGEKRYISNLEKHPFFSLLRNFPIKLTLCSDNPEMAGVPIQRLMMLLAGIIEEGNSLPSKWLHCLNPLKTHELVSLLINGIEAAFCETSVKTAYMDKLLNVVHQYVITADEKLLYG